MDNWASSSVKYCLAFRASKAKSFTCHIKLVILSSLSPIFFFWESNLQAEYSLLSCCTFDNIHAFYFGQSVLIRLWELKPLANCFFQWCHSFSTWRHLSWLSPFSGWKCALQCQKWKIKWEKEKPFFVQSLCSQFLSKKFYFSSILLLTFRMKVVGTSLCHRFSSYFLYQFRSQLEIWD